MQKHQNTQSHPLSTKSSPNVGGGIVGDWHPLPIALTGSSNTVGVTSTVPYSALSISNIATTARIEPMLAGYILTQFGNQLATMLARVLDELEKDNREAIGPIVSILEPYMQVNRGLKVNIRPKSSREVNIEITKVGRVTPKIHLDESLT